jgi:putative lipoic acid-binding regulatory protein
MTTKLLPEDPKESLFEFPCSFSVKAMGKSHDQFESLVVALVSQHVPDLPESSTKVRQSKESNFMAVTVTFTAVSREQLDDVYRALSGHPEVLMAI